jgi:hypothetical protein
MTSRGSPRAPNRLIYTTNYDTVIEQSYDKKGVKLDVYKSNFDFRPTSSPLATQLYKLHGSIGEDVSTGSQARIIISGSDYNQTHEYRQHLYTGLKADLSHSRLIIIGHSLADDHIKSIVNEAISLIRRHCLAAECHCLCMKRI